jgi:ferrochelatase
VGLKTLKVRYRRSCVRRCVATFLQTSSNWAAKITGINDYSQNEDYTNIVVQHTEEALASFAGSTPSNTCIMFACHGIPERLVKAGDPYEAQIKQNFQTVSNYFLAAGYSNVSLAFQNHGGKGTTFPQNLFSWSSPPDTDVVPTLASAPCSHILITGALSFVVDNSETEFDERIDDVKQIKKLAPHKTVFVPEVFSSPLNGYKSNKAFEAFLAGVISDAIEGRGDLINIQKSSEEADEKSAFTSIM